MYFIWNLGLQEANLTAFNQFNEVYQRVIAQGSNALKAIFEMLDMQYPNASGTERYANPIIHPSDGRVAMPAPEAMMEELSDDLRIELWTLVTEPTEIVASLTSDWLPESMVN